MPALSAMIRRPAQRARRYQIEHFNRTRRTWRNRFAAHLTGRGLEIGALTQPMPVREGVQVRYVDRHDLRSLCTDYPTLAADAFRAPDIVDDGETLATLPDASEDFIIAAHVFEHLRNPLGALAAWARVLRPGGLIYLAVPDKRFTFDRHRQVTPLEHLVLDYTRPSADRDYEHFLDYALHVHRAQTPGDALEEADRLLGIDFSIHYHVFVADQFRPLIDWFTTHVRPLELVDGPVRPWPTDEFHVLLRVPTR